MFLDITGALSSLLSTCLYIRLNRFAWLFTLIATTLNGWLYWKKGIYADTALETGYFITAFYGWFMWRRLDDTNKSTVKSLSWLQWILLLFTLGLIYTLLEHLLNHYTNTTVAKLDALTTSLSLIAQGLMAQRIMATWIFWFVTDSIYVYLYAIKQLHFHALLLLVYTGLAVVGYRSWRKRELNH